MQIRKLADIAHRGHNSFNLVRLLAASAVVLSHSFYITMGTSVREPLELSTGYPLGAHAVNLFFALSGFMVAASWQRNPDMLTYLTSRALRLYPALIASAILVYLAGALLTTVSMAEYFSFSVGWPYFKLLVLELTGKAHLPGVFEHLPAAGEINEPIWTLKYEVMCYASLAVVLWLTQKQSLIRQELVMVFLAGLCLIALVAGKNYEQATLLDHLARMGFAFFTGASAWFLRHRIPLSWPLFVFLFVSAIFLTVWELPMRRPVFILAVVYGATMLASLDFARLTRITDKTDISYGIYVFAWPVQQALMQAGIATTPLQNTAATLLTAGFLAFASWHTIEKPTLSLRGLITQ